MRKLSHIVLLMTALLCLASEPLPRNASGQPTNQPNDKDSNGQQYHRKTVPIAIAQANTHIVKEVSDNGQHEKDQEKDSDWWMTAFTGAIAILAFLQLLTFLSQRRVTIFAERAQLVILPISPPGSATPITGFAVGQHPKFNGHIVNIGNTPAYALTYDAWMELIPPPFDDFPDGTRVGHDTEAKTVYPQPVGALSLGVMADHPLSQQDLDDWSRGQRELWIRIRLKYRDVFRKLWFRRKRFAEFGWKYTNIGLIVFAKYQDSN